MKVSAIKTSIAGMVIFSSLLTFPVAQAASPQSVVSVGGRLVAAYLYYQLGENHFEEWYFSASMPGHVVSSTPSFSTAGIDLTKPWVYVRRNDIVTNRFGLPTDGPVRHTIDRVGGIDPDEVFAAADTSTTVCTTMMNIPAWEPGWLFNYWEIERFDVSCGGSKVHVDFIQMHPLGHWSDNRQELLIQSAQTATGAVPSNASDQELTLLTNGIRRKEFALLSVDGQRRAFIFDGVTPSGVEVSAGIWTAFSSQSASAVGVQS